MLYFLARDNQKVGPFSLQQVLSAINEGTFDNNDLVWHSGMKNWVKVGGFHEFLNKSDSNNKSAIFFNKQTTPTPSVKSAPPVSKIVIPRVKTNSTVAVKVEKPSSFEPVQNTPPTTSDGNVRPSLIPAQATCTQQQTVKLLATTKTRCDKQLNMKPNANKIKLENNGFKFQFNGLVFRSILIVIGIFLVFFCVIKVAELMTPGFEQQQAAKNNALISASKDGKTNRIQELLKKGAYVNACDSQGLTSLCWSILGGHSETAIELINNGANLEALWLIGRTPAEQAAINNDTVLLQAIKIKGARLDHALHASIAAHSEDAFRVLIRMGVDLEELDDEGNTPLMLAVKAKCKWALMAEKSMDSRHLEQEDWLVFVKTLLASGVDAEVLDPQGHTALAFADSVIYETRGGRGTIVSMRAIRDVLNFNRPVAQPSSADDIAILEDVDTSEMLLDSAATTQDITSPVMSRNVNHMVPKKATKTTQVPNTSKGAAIENAGNQSTEDIVEKSAPAVMIPPKPEVPCNLEAIVSAAEWGNLNVVKASSPKCLAMRNSRGRTAILEAADHNRREILDLLIRNNVDINVQDNDSRTALIEATDRQFLDVVEMLCRAGADVNISEKRGRTPLLIATEKGNLSIIKILLQYGGKADMADIQGQTAIDIAKKKKLLGIIGLFENR